MRTLVNILSYLVLALFAGLVIYSAVDGEGRFMGETDSIYAFCIYLVGWVCGAFIWSIWRDKTKEWDEYDQAFQLSGGQCFFREIRFLLAILFVFGATVVIKKMLLPFTGMPESGTIIQLVVLAAITCLIVFLLTKNWNMSGTPLPAEPSIEISQSLKRDEGVADGILFLRQRMNMIVKSDGSILTEDQINEELEDVVDNRSLPKEAMYAEIVTRLLNAPEEIKEQCPLFWNVWESALEKHSDINAAYSDMRAHIRKT